MDVELPTTGCNILINSSSFYNYSQDSRTRNQYYIYDGVAHLQSSTTNQYGYTYTGDCLSTGDLVYKPELKVWYPLSAFCVICFLLLMIYRIFLKRLLP